MLAAAPARKSARKPAPVDSFAQELAGLRAELFAHAMKRVRNPEAADDLVQDTVERALRFQDHFQRGTKLSAWAHQVLFSLFLSRCRRLRNERKAIGVLITGPLSWQLPCAEMEAIALSPPVARALDALPPDFRAVVMLLDIKEVPYKEAARRLQIPVGTLMSRVHRGRKLLARQLRDDGQALRRAA
jgi:RNA polymerase sigma-70 factor (ECF subfamily)